MNKNNTVEEIKGKLDELGIEYKSNLNKDELLALFPEEGNQTTDENDEEQKRYVVIGDDEPKKYVVIRDFKDLQDKNKIYIRGDFYPKGDYEPSSARIEELKSDKNKQRKQIIKEQD